MPCAPASFPFLFSSFDPIFLFIFSISTLNFLFGKKMVSLHNFAIVALTLFGYGSAANQHQLPLQSHYGSKDLVNSTELQALIKPENLLSRAKDLYHVAELAIEEYGHPTRVIGSKGMRTVRFSLSQNLDFIIAN